MKHFELYDNTIKFDVSDADWDFLCKYRFFTKINGEPDEERIRIEFTTGTGITPDRPHLWDTATKAFAEYIEDLREMQGLDINKMARDTLTKEEKYGVIA